MQVGLKGEPPAGILLIDKPTGWTSHDVVNKIRRLLKVKKVGHAGTLDPLATGLLVVLVGREFTKRQAEFLKQDKEYECLALLGVETDTYDVDGQVVKSAETDLVAEITQEQVEEVLEKYRGKILQTVPSFSAVRVKGEKLYEKARRGDKVELPQREVEIKELELIAFKDGQCKLKIACSSGTYVRSLVHDIGQDLGIGATVKKLMRTKIGAFSVDQAQTIKELETKVSQSSN